ncbi:MAG: dynamin family protein [Myxococcota bacterium]
MTEETNGSAAPVAERLLEVADQLSDIAGELGIDDLGETIKADASRRLEDNRVRAVVLGEIKQGKSTLINAVLQRPALPTGVTPTTGAIATVRVGSKPGRWLVADEGDRESLTDARFKALATGKEKSGDHASIELVIEDGALPDTLELIDTPGMNDMARVRGAISRGELPRADVLVLVLDATQLLNRAEMAFLRDAVAAVGGLDDSGARLCLVINRIDLVEEADRPKLVEYLNNEISAVAAGDAAEAIEIFQTNARGALAEPDAATFGVQEVARLREFLKNAGKHSTEVLPARARASLLRHTALLSHNAAIASRAVTLEREILRREIRTIERDLVDNDNDLVLVRNRISEDRKALVESSRERVAEFRTAIEASTLEKVRTANLREVSTLLPGALHDAFLAYAHGESQKVREALDEMTRAAIRTHGEQARRRLFHATMRLGFRGPTIYVDPPSMALEAGLVAIGLAGTAVMYFGSLYAGLAMTIAGPLATVFLREKSLRSARERANRELPAALDLATAALKDNIEVVIDKHVAALDEHLVLANVALGKQLLGILERARTELGEDEAVLADKRTVARSRYHAIEHELASIRTTLDGLTG